MKFSKIIKDGIDFFHQDRPAVIYRFSDASWTFSVMDLTNDGGWQQVEKEVTVTDKKLRKAISVLGLASGAEDVLLLNLKRELNL